VHRARNLYAKSASERVKRSYWQALDDAINERDGKQRLHALVAERDKGGFTAAAKCQADDLDALVVHLADPTPPAVAKHQPARAVTWRGQTADESDRPVPGEDSCLTHVWAVLDLLITHQTNGIRFTELDRQRLNRAR
jgi:hypothetical protein